MTGLRTFLFARRHLLGVLLCGAVAMAFWFKATKYPAPWEALGIPAAYRPFMDTRVLTDGVVAFRQGIDPMRHNIGDIERRPLNYPRLWQGLFLLGLDQEDDLWLGAVFVALFFIGVVIATPGGSLASGIAMGLAVFSPAVLFGFERGNTDLPIFFLLALAVALFRRARTAALLVVILAFMLKLYPLAALVLFLDRDRATAIRPLFILGAFAPLYVLFTLGDLAVIKSSTIQSAWISYGMDVPWRVLLDGSDLRHVAAMRWICLLVAAGCVAWSGWRRASLAAGDDGPALDGFRVGAACYAGTFLLSTNFDYKQLPVVLTIPQLLLWSRTPALGRCGIARFALASVYLSLWALMVEQLPRSDTGRWVGFIVGEIGQWSAFATLVWLVGQTLPDWLSSRRPWRKLPVPAVGNAPAP